MATRKEVGVLYRSSISRAITLLMQEGSLLDDQWDASQCHGPHRKSSRVSACALVLLNHLVMIVAIHIPGHAYMCTLWEPHPLMLMLQAALIVMAHLAAGVLLSFVLIDATFAASIPVIVKVISHV